MQNVMTVKSESPTAPATAMHLSGLSVGSLTPHTCTQSLISVVAMIVIGVTAPSSRSMKKGDLVVTCIKRIRVDQQEQGLISGGEQNSMNTAHEYWNDLIEESPPENNHGDWLIQKWSANLVVHLPTDARGMLGGMYRDHCMESVCCLVGHVTTCNSLNQIYHQSVYSDTLVQSIDQFLFLYDDMKSRGVDIGCIHEWAYVRDNCSVLVQDLSSGPMMHEQTGFGVHPLKEEKEGAKNVQPDCVWNLSL